MQISIFVKSPNKKLGGNLAGVLFLIILGAFMCFPVIFAVSNAFKPMNELFYFPPRLWAENPTTDNFADLFALLNDTLMPMSRYLFNTVGYSVIGTGGNVIFCSMAAYVLAKHEFPGQKFYSGMIILSLMFSPHVTSIPNYIIMSKIGWVDTVFAVVLPAFAMSGSLYLMKNFMENVPITIIEAARIDGAREVRVFWQIVMPAVKPAWITLIIFSFNSLWSATAGRYIYSEQLKTMPDALQQIASGGIARTGVSAAAALLMLLVPLGVFVFSQSNVLETMATSGLNE